MPDNLMLPQSSMNSLGSATPGTIFGGAFEGPLTINETNLTFIRTTRPVSLKDAIAGLATGAAAAQGHAYLISVGNVQNVVGILFAAQLAPTSVVRHVTPFKFPAGVDLFIRAVQLTGVAAEATTLTLFWG